MKVTREFTYNNVPCSIVYMNENKEYCLAVYGNDERSIMVDLKRLFPVKKYSESSNDIAFHVANLHYKNLISAEYHSK